MAKHIFDYADNAAYIAGAAERPQGESIVSRIDSDIKYEGTNVIMDFNLPGKTKGDSAYWDAVLGKVVLIKAGTLNVAKLDTARYINLCNTYEGSAYGRDIFVDDRAIASKPFASPDEWKISGIDTSADGSAEITFKYYSATGDYVKNLTLSWAAGDTIASIRAQIDAAAGIKSYCNTFAIDDTSFGVNVNGYSTSMGLTLVSGDVVVERTYQGYQARSYTALPVDAKAVSNSNENGTTWPPRVQYEKASEYWATNGATPSAEVTLASSVVKKTEFNTSEYCADIRQMFCADPDHPTDADYVRYTDTVITKLRGLRYPCTRGTNYKFAFGDNLDNSRILARVSHVRSDGETIWDFPNARDADLLGVVIPGVVTGFEPGTGHLGGNMEAKILYNNTLKAQTDPINTAIAAKGGIKISYSETMRLAFQRNSYYAWIFSGTDGCLNSGARSYAAPARVFRAF